MLDFALSFIGVAALVAIADIVWTLYFIATANREAAKAGAWSALTIGLGAITTISYIHDPLLVLAAMVGAFVGTWATIRWMRDVE